MEGKITKRGRGEAFYFHHYELNSFSPNISVSSSLANTPQNDLFFCTIQKITTSSLNSTMPSEQQQILQQNASSTTLYKCSGSSGLLRAQSPSALAILNFAENLPRNACRCYTNTTTTDSQW